MMFFQRRMLIPIAAAIVMLLISACGSSTTAGNGSYSTTGTQSPTTATTPGTTSTNVTTGSAVVRTTTATVGGKSEIILTNARGMTLYYFTPDTATTATCTGGCASTWPPLLYSGSGAPTSSTTLSGTLATATNANGKQVLYNNHFLYNFSGDTSPGQTNGEGIAGNWFVATPNLGATKSVSGY